jgi:DNA polymerase-4
VEPLSLDEAFLDTRRSERLYGPADVIGRQIKDAISNELSLIASVGIAPNKFLAKLASDHDKPDGFTVVEENAVEAFLDPMPVNRLWGVGKATLARLHALNIRTVRDLRSRPALELQNELGRVGAHLHELAHGRDRREVKAEREAKSISHETTFAADVRRIDVLEAALMQLTESVGVRLRSARLRARTVTLKLRDPDFSTHTISSSFVRATDLTTEIWQSARRMLHARRAQIREVRLIGVGVSNLEACGSTQTDLFDKGDDVGRKARIDALTDTIKSRFGERSIGRGTRYRGD